MKPDVTILDFGDTGNEPYVIRDLAESYRSTALLVGLGKPSELLTTLRQTESRLLFLCLHGDSDGFILPELAKEIAEKEKYSGHLTAEDLKAELKLKKNIVISTACNTGSEKFGKAFVEGGAEAYIAPDGYPEGDAIPFFLSHFLYGLLAKSRSVKAAFKKAQEQDSETKLFRLYS